MKTRDGDSTAGAATENPTLGFQQPLNVPLEVAASIEDICTEPVSKWSPDEVKYSSELDAAGNNVNIVISDIITSDAPSNDIVTNNDKVDKGVVVDSFDRASNKEAAIALPF
jgi:hypothetical protein